jgi:chromosomal replication initiator protein
MKPVRPTDEGELVTTTVSSERSLCARIVDRLAASLGERRFNMWFNRTAKFAYDQADARLQIHVPNQFVADWIDRHFDEQLRQAVLDETGADHTELAIEVSPDLFNDAEGLGDEKPTQPAELKPMARPRRSTPYAGANEPRHRLNIRHRLDTFIVGPSNELAFSAASRLVDDRDCGAVNPLFIHGGCGLGKTHLLQGICARLLEMQPDARVLYTTGEQFTNDFLTSMRANKLDAFRRRIRDLDLLAVDDVHFIANKQATQQEFLHSFDAIDLGGARVVLASDNHPKLINAFSESLVSRCVRGMVVEVRQPDLETRRRLVDALSRRRGMTLRDTVVDEVAQRCAGSVREIEGLLTRLHALCRLSLPGRPVDTGEPIGHAMLSQLFEEEMQSRPRKAVRLQDIIDVVSSQLGVERGELLSNTRRKHAVTARSLAAYLARQMTSMSYPEIAAGMSRPNHSTIITAVQRVEKQIGENVDITLPATLETVSLRDMAQRLQQAVWRT